MSESNLVHLSTKCSRRPTPVGVERGRQPGLNPTLDAAYAIFLDRDGVINRERSDYVRSWTEFKFLPGALQALRRLATLDCPILVVTNQSAIGRGLVEYATVCEIHQRMIAAIEAAGGRIDAVFVCPHHPDDACQCRKPRPGLLHLAAEQYQLRLAGCYFVGDAITDYQAALAAGCRSILVQTGLQAIELPRLLTHASTVPLVANLQEAATLILEQIQSS